eukprot:gene167-301_t
MSRIQADGRLPSAVEFASESAVVQHRPTRKILKYLEAIGLMPVDAQVRVVDTDARCRTAADIVCARVERISSLVIVEVKCGFDGYVSLSSGRMQFELRKVPDSPRNQHHLQVAVTRELYMRTYTGDVDAIVLWANESTVRHERVERWAAVHASDVLDRIKKKAPPLEVPKQRKTRVGKIAKTRRV